MNATALSISNISIRQDDQGRFCLNDLHRASGSQPKNKPSEWLRTKQATELVDEVTIAGIPAIESKQQLGTFVVKELVYAYAMWISPSFHLKVIRAYDEMVRNPSQSIDPMQALNDPATMRGLLLNYSEKVLTLESKVAEQAPIVEAMQRLDSSEGSLNITEAAKAAKIQPKEAFRLLQLHKWIYKRAGGRNWLGYQDKIQQGLLEHKVTSITKSDGSEKIIEQVLLTAKGIAKFSSIVIGEAA